MILHSFRKATFLKALFIYSFIYSFLCLSIIYLFIYLSLYLFHLFNLSYLSDLLVNFLINLINLLIYLLIYRLHWLYSSILLIYRFLKAGMKPFLDFLIEGQTIPQRSCSRAQKISRICPTVGLLKMTHFLSLLKACPLLLEEEWDIQFWSFESFVSQHQKTMCNPKQENLSLANIFCCWMQTIKPQAATVFFISDCGKPGLFSVA